MMELTSMSGTDNTLLDQSHRDERQDMAYELAIGDLLKLGPRLYFSGDMISTSATFSADVDTPVKSSIHQL